MQNYTDEQLVKNYLAGDEEALEILIRRYLRPIYNFAYRNVGIASDAEDITQEIFIKAWCCLKKFDPNRSFKIWLFKIAQNTTIDFFRKRKIVPFSAFEDEKKKNALVELIADPAPLPEEIFDRKNLIQELSAAMEKLSPKYRTVLFLHYNDHFTFREIAEILGESIDTVKSWHRRAIIELRKLLFE